MRDLDTIVALYVEREKTQQPVMAKRLETREVYENEFEVPLPELNSEERPAVPNLLQQGVDQLATRVSSTSPMPVYVPAKENATALEKARSQRAETLGFWDASAMDLVLAERARHFLAYGLTPVMIRPDRRTEMPRWHVRSPLTTYPAPAGRAQDYDPPDCHFAFQRTWAWLQAGGYAEPARALLRPQDARPDDRFDIIEYVDDEQITLIALGKAKDDAYPTVGANRAVLLERLPNKAERCTAVVPGRITLDKPMGQFDGIIGMYWLQAMLMALEVIAAKKGIFSDFWLLGEGNQPPEVITRADGMRGVIGKASNARPFERQPQPGFMTNPTIDRIERAQRLTGGIPAELGGESGSNIRTGRRGDAVLSAAIDMRILEAQKIFARSLMLEDEVAVAVAKGYWPSRYNNIFDQDLRHHVKYAMAGTDVNNLVISGGQRLGLKSLSRLGFMEIDPLVEDPELEHDRIIAEGIEDAVLSAFQAAAASGETPPIDAARVMELVRTNGKELAEAIQQAQQEAQQRQAEAVPAGDPRAQPGLGPAGMGAEQPTIAPPDESLGNLANLMSQLRRPSAVGEQVA